VAFVIVYCRSVLSSGLRFGFLGGITTAAATLSWGSRVEELDAMGAAAGGADDLAELADDHQLAGLDDEVDAGDLADLAGGLHVDDARAAAGLKAVLVNAGALAVAVLRNREDEAEPNSQNGNPSKINPEKVACFSSPKTDRKLPSFHQESTTTSPPKNHIQPPVFAKTPSKNKVPPPKEITAKGSLFQARFWLLRGDDGGRYFVLVFEVEGPRRRPTRANSPPTENAPGMSHNPSATKFLRRTQLRLIA
jgi:hypothetical protein